MKKGTLLYIVYVIAVPAIMMLASTCKTDNSLQSSLESYDPILNLARYIRFNRSYTNRVQGVYTLSLAGTQSFDSYYWGWEKGTPQGMQSYYNNTGSTNHIPAYFLSNGGKTLNTVHSFNENIPSGPQYYHYHSTAAPFSDGTFSSTGASTGILRPLQFDSIRRNRYNSSGELTYDANLRTYSLTYDEETGLIQSYSILTQNNTTDTTTLNTYQFSEDPRSHSSYYASRYTKKSGSNNTLVGYVTTDVSTDSSTGYPTETYTYQRFDETETLGAFDASSDLGYLDANFFDDANGSTIVKIIKTITTYWSASSDGDIESNSVATVTEKYSSESDIVYKEESIKHYESSLLHKLADYQTMTYNVSGSTETQISQQKKWYTDGFLVRDNSYTQAIGWDAPSSYILYTRDNQGRITSKAQYNSDDEMTSREVYTFGSNGRTSTIRSYAVDSDGVETCSSANNKEYTYTAVSSGRQVAEISYACDGDGLAENPSSKTVWTYNTLGKLTNYQVYNYLTFDFMLSAQTTYGYGSSGEKTYTQYYTVDGSGEATASNRIEYTYDDNLFRTSTIYKNADDDITGSYYVYSYTYR